MNSSRTDKILGLPRRPALADASTAALLGAVAVGLLTGGLGGVLIGGASGAVLANQKQPLEFAVREYFKQKGLEVIFFYRAPRAVKVTFSYAPNAFWTVETVMPDDLENLSDEDRDDWLYGSLITKALPKVLQMIKNHARMNLSEAIEQLNKIAFTDDKTPLENALALNKEVVLIDAGRSDFDVIVFGDLNEFKLFNNNYSHEAGDVAIRKVGEKIQEDVVTKIKARAFRQSGDEFIILLKRSQIKTFLSKASSFASVTFFTKRNFWKRK